MKPLKERIQIYIWIGLAIVIGSIGLLLTGYDYRRNKGFYKADDREAMSFIEMLGALPSELIWSILALIFIIVVVELFIFIVMFIKGNS